jgi:hypothetical protein
VRVKRFVLHKYVLLPGMLVHTYYTNVGYRIPECEHASYFTCDKKKVLKCAVKNGKIGSESFSITGGRSIRQWRYEN